ncbi:MAG: isocitrate/isopropylmalate family dehydrogenase, partial [Caulobacterales bacterium]
MLLLLPGDGIGPEVIAEVRRLIEVLRADGLALEVETAPFGGAAIDQFGVPITDDAVAAAKASDAVLMGAVGGPQWAKVARDKR